MHQYYSVSFQSNEILDIASLKHRAKIMHPHFLYVVGALYRRPSGGDGATIQYCSFCLHMIKYREGGT
jgi:hypothetical protein